MTTTRDLDKGSSEVNLVALVSNRLNTAVSRIVLVPAVAMNILALFTGVSEA